MSSGLVKEARNSFQDCFDGSVYIFAALQNGQTPTHTA